jgi:drug/metabolite transporter (DMT)-like permease
LTATSTTYLKLTGAMFMWGGTWIAGRIVAQEVPAPLMAAAFRFLIAGVVLAGFALAAEGQNSTPGQRVASGASSAGWRSPAFFIYALCFFYGLRYISGRARGARRCAQSGYGRAPCAWFAGQEKMTPLKLAGIVIAMIGCLTVVGNGNPLALLHGAVGMGEWLILGCALCWTAYTFIGRQATLSLSPLTATLYASLIGSLLLGITALLQGGTEIAEWSWRVWSSVAFLAIGGTALAFTWFADGVKRIIGAAKASVFVNLVPVFAVLQAAILLDERLGFAVLSGGLLVIAGVWLTTNFSERTA